MAVLRAFTPPTTNSFVSESALPILGNESRKRSEPLEKRSFSDQSGSARFTPVGGLRSERPECFSPGKNKINCDTPLLEDKYVEA